jgi:hypothetical protein
LYATNKPRDVPLKTRQEERLQKEGLKRRREKRQLLHLQLVAPDPEAESHLLLVVEILLLLRPPLDTWAWAVKEDGEEASHEVEVVLAEAPPGEPLEAVQLDDCVDQLVTTFSMCLWMESLRLWVAGYHSRQLCISNLASVKSSPVETKAHRL